MRRFFRSLRGKILMAVLLCAVMPLAAVGIWLTTAAARSGERLLRSQLDSALERTASAARDRWAYRRSDALLLANNEPIRAALRSADTTADLPSFVRRAYETMPNVAGVVIRDRHGQTRWILGAARVPRPGAERPNDVGTTAQELFVRASVRDHESELPLGEVLLSVRVDALLPATASLESPERATQFIAVHDRIDGAWLRPLTLLPSTLASSQFTWEGRRWISSHRSLDSPPLDIFAVAALDPFVEPFSHTANLGVAALTIVAFAVVILTMIVTSRLTQSLTELADAADVVGHGDFTSQIDERSSDEVGRVARAFNAMTANVRRMMTELSQREAVAAMGEVAATLAHQVRSPVTALRLDVERAHDRLAEGGTERMLLGRALEQLDRLERAVEASLRIARSTGSVFQDVDVREPLARALADVAREHASRGVRIICRTVDDAPMLVRGDAASLEQLFVNLVANAAQASGVDEVVSVSWKRTDEAMCCVTIRDDGEGMTPDAVARVGQAFKSTRPGGTGLGLVIAKRIVAAHRGILAIESVERVGTTVRVELPSVMQSPSRAIRAVPPPTA